MEKLPGGVEKWKDLLISGRHVYIVAGTDAHGHFNELAGRVKNYVYIPGYNRTNLPLPDKIIEALRNGHSIMTDGPIVVFNITNQTGGNSNIGDTINGNKFFMNVGWKSTPEFGNLSFIHFYQGILGENETEQSALSFSPGNLEGAKTYNLENYTLLNSYIRLNATTDKGYKLYANPIFINSDPTGTPTSTPPPENIVSRYAGNDGLVQKSEAMQALFDYFEGSITKQETIPVMIAYFER